MSTRRMYGNSAKMQRRSLFARDKREGLEAITWIDDEGNKHRVSAKGKVTKCWPKDQDGSTIKHHWENGE